MDWLAAAADTHPEVPAVITAERTVSYAELDCAANGVASFVAAGDRSNAVAFWGDRSLETVAAVWGIPRAGMTAVAVDPRTPPADAMEAARAAGVHGLWVTPDGGFDRLLDRGAAGFEAKPRPEAAYIVFTSGSGGRPKGVLLTDDNVAAAVAGSRDRLGNGPADTWLCVLPLFHVGGLSILWRQAESGAPVVLVDRFDPVAEALDGVTFASLVPVSLRRLVATERRWEGLRAVLVGGAAADDHLLAAARSAGIPAVPTYGMTETCSQIATPSPGAPLDGSVGLPLSGAEIRVLSEGAPVVGVEGRIEVRGPMVSPGYVGGPERSGDDWLTTSDLGVLGHDGHLSVTGRADAVIVTGGENVDPEAVQRVLAAHPAVRASRVFGLPDSEWGMLVVAEVETDVGSEELEAWAAERMPPNMRPREWRIVERLSDKFGT